LPRCEGLDLPQYTLHLRVAQALEQSLTGPALAPPEGCAEYLQIGRPLGMSSDIALYPLQQDVEVTYRAEPAREALKPTSKSVETLPGEEWDLLEQMESSTQPPGRDPHVMDPRWILPLKSNGLTRT